MEIQYAQDGCTIDLGHRGETGVTQVIFDVSPWVKEFGAGAAVVLARRSVDRTPYPVAIEQDGGMVTWTVGAADTAYTGSGKVELYYYVQEQLVKTAVYKTSVSPDIGAQDADVPDQYQGWVDKITRVGTQAGIDAQSAAASAQAAADSAEGAAGSAANAGESAGAAEQSAQKAETAAQTATEQAGKAQASEVAAQRSATEASQSATTATDKAAEAAQSDQAAQQAQAAAETAQGKAEDAQAAAEEAARQAAQSAETAGETALGAYVCKEAEGAAVSFDDGADGMPVKSLTAAIDYVKGGRADVRVTRCGKNLLKLAEEETVRRDWDLYVPNPIRSAGTYTISCQSLGTASKRGAAVWLANDRFAPIGTYLAGYAFGDSLGSSTFTATPEQSAASYIVFGFRSGGAVFGDLAEAQLKIESGTTATAYEPYTGTTYPINWEAEAGTVYGGELDLTEGLLTSTLDADGNPLEEPLVYQLTPTEVRTLLGANTIWADCGPLSVTYRADPTILHQKLVDAIISTGGNV